MTWQERATELTTTLAPDLTAIRSALEHCELGLLTEPARDDLFAPLAVLYVDVAVAELCRLGALDTVTTPVTGPVTCADVLDVLRWADATLDHCTYDPDQLIDYAYAVDHLQDAITTLTDS